MNCDQVFCVLTRGPFPTGDRSDLLVEQHLEECASCWQIAEALKPAHHVFEESVPAAQLHDLPGYWGDAVPSGVAYEKVRISALRTEPAQQVKQAPQAIGFLPEEVAGPFTWYDATRVVSLGLVIGGVGLGALWWMLG